MTQQATPTFSVDDLDAVETVDDLLRAATAGAQTPDVAPPASWTEAHVHDRRCWWDVMECRWAGPAHPDPRRR